MESWFATFKFELGERLESYADAKKKAGGRRRVDVCARLSIPTFAARARMTIERQCLEQVGSGEAERRCDRGGLTGLCEAHVSRSELPKIADFLDRVVLRIAAIRLSMWKSKETYDPTRHRKQSS